MAGSLTLYLALGLTSGAALLYEIVLTRVFAIAQGYHFGFLAISLALLGFGASGTALALYPPRQASRARLATLALLLALGLPGSYLLANYLPFDSYRVAWEPVQLVYLAAYLVALVAPFFLAGLLQGLPLMLWPERTGPLYAANLTGSGLGCALALAVLNWTSEEGAVALAAMVAGGAAFLFMLPVPSGSRRAPWADRLIRASAAAVMILGAALAVQQPPWFELRLSPYKPLSQILNYPEARWIARRGNAFSRVEVVDSPHIRSAPGLSLAFAGTLPRQTAVVVDAETVLALTEDPGPADGFLDALPMALPYRLRPQARALILEPGGGLDVLVALHHGAALVVAVESNPLIADLQASFAERAGHIAAEPRVHVARASTRGYIARSREPFDVIEVALSDNFRAVSAGAFTLSEDYGMTVEAFRGYLGRLAPRGLLVVHRWLQTPPTEEVRAGALVITALQESGVPEPRDNVVALRSFSTLLLLARREPFEPREIEAVKAFARERQFDLVYYPGIQRGETNQFQILQVDEYFDAFQKLLADAPQFYRQYAFDVAPPVDDHPFFFHFFKWEQTPLVLALLGKTWQPFGGSGYLILLALLGVTLLLSLALILLPVVVRRHARGAVRTGGWIHRLVYFAALGCGYLLIEIPLIQRLVLFLDYPVYAFTVVLLGLLVFSGLGSLYAERVPWRGALGTLVLAVLVYPALLPQVLAALIGQDFAIRVLVALVLLAPLGFLLGVPFPRGLRRLSLEAPALVPLAWAVNGFTSVLSSILATVIALSWGLTFVWTGAGLAYALALAVLASASPASAAQRSRP